MINSRMLTLNDTGSGLSGFTNGSFDTITVNTDLSAVTLVSRLISILAAMAAIYGLIKLGSGVISYLEASGDDNTAAQSKAGKQIGAGIMLVAAGLVMTFIFS